MGVPERMIVFIVGGATYEEAKEISAVYNVPANSLGGALTKSLLKSQSNYRYTDYFVFILHSYFCK